MKASFDLLKWGMPSHSGEVRFLVTLLFVISTTFAIAAPAVTVTGPGGSHSDIVDLNWSVVPSPHKPGVTLYGISAISPTQAWAVGDIYSPLTPIIYRWNGISWKQVSAGAIPDSSLRDVAAISASGIWAVGYQQSADGGDLTVTLHSDGVSWTRVSSPNPSSENYLTGVAAVSTNDVWAVGSKETDTLYAELILHWDGNTWTESTTRAGGYRVLTDVAAVATNDVWAIGYTFSFNEGYQGLAMHWDGARWSDVAVPVTVDGYTFLYGLAVISAADIWAVGSGGVNPIKPLIAHWNGTTWSYVANPAVQTDYAFLKNVTALATDDVWAIGYFTDQTGRDRNLVEHWDGVAWMQTGAPEVRRAHNELWAIAPDQGGGVWTVGKFLPTDFSRSGGSLVLRGSP